MSQNAWIIVKYACTIFLHSFFLCTAAGPYAVFAGDGPKYSLKGRNRGFPMVTNSVDQILEQILGGKSSLGFRECWGRENACYLTNMPLI